MLSRGFYDALSIWPIVVWPLIFSSAFFAYLRLCKVSQQRHGFSPLNGRRKSDAVATYLFFPAAATFEGAAHIYLLWMIGYLYAAIVVPVYAIGWIVVPWMLDGIRSAHVLLPIVYVCFASAFVVLLGFADIGVLRALNSELYSTLTGFPARL